MVNKIKLPAPTKEQMEYEEAKKSFRFATAKARLHSVGIDQSKISQQVIDKAMRIFDEMDHIQQDTQQKTSKLQHDAEAAIQKVNQDASQKFGEIQTRYQDFVNSLNKDKKEDDLGDNVQTQTDVQLDVQESADIQVEAQPEQVEEEVIEKTHEEKVSEITDILLHAMRGQISEKVNEIMCIVDKKIDDTAVKTGENQEVTNIQKTELGPVGPVEYTDIMHTSTTPP